MSDYTTSGLKLTDLMPTLYQAADIVARELVGFIPSVYKNTSAERAALNEVVRYPIADPISGENVIPGSAMPSETATGASYGDMKIAKVRRFKFVVTGEDTKGVKNSGEYETLMRDRFTQAMRGATNEIEAELAGLYAKASRAAKHGGAKIFESSFVDALNVNKILTDNGAPLTDRALILDTAGALNLKSLSNYSQAMAAGGAEFRQGVLFPLDGLEIRQSAQIKSHVAGTWAAGSKSSDASVKGDTTIGLTVSGSMASKVGDGIKFADQASPDFYISQTALTQTTGDHDIVIAKPGLLAAIGNSKAITGLGSYTANMAFHKNAIHLITRAPGMPEGGDAADDAVLITDPNSGITYEVRVYRQYHQVMYELVIAYGAAVVKPEFLAILAG